MKPLFNQIAVKAPKKNLFDMSFEKKLSCNMAELVPVYVQEVMPGDKFKVDSEALVRLAPMVAPMMHRVNIYFHYFYVPMRLLWANWENYITGGVDGLQAPALPTFNLTDARKADFGAGTLPDYMGIPIPQTGTIVNVQAINALPFRAYAQIWNNYYRDETLHTAKAVTTNDTVSAGEYTDIVALASRCWEKDYFTSALPWTQRGATVNLPSTPNYKANPLVKTNTSFTANENLQATTSANSSTIKGGTSGQIVTSIDNLNSVDISVINLRRAIKLQQWLEKQATAGYRLIESVLVHFGVKTKDSRLQRPEYLGGGKMPVTVSEVVSMVKETSNPQGTMTGHGISAGAHNGFRRFFEEHGYVIGIMSVMPRTAYQQGLPRMYSKVDRFDFPWPEFAQIGEQAILNKEIYTDFIGADTNNNVFGYTPRYAEYKFNHSTVHGDFKTNLNYWHMGRIFTSMPALNSNFVTADPTNRVFAVADTSDHLWIQLYFDVKAVRPLPVFGTPTL